MQNVREKDGRWIGEGYVGVGREDGDRMRYVRVGGEDK